MKPKNTIKSCSGGRSKVCPHPWRDLSSTLGLVKDYYIALGLRFKGQLEFPAKKFYWCNDEFKFAELPAPALKELKEKVESIRTPFTGDHTKIVVRGQGKSKDCRAVRLSSFIDLAMKADGEQGKGKNLTELDRLAVSVHQIDLDTSIAPIGYLRLTPNHELRHNADFHGLNLNDFKNLNSYVHFRRPLTTEKQEFIGKALEPRDSR